MNCYYFYKYILGLIQSQAEIITGNTDCNRITKGGNLFNLN